MSLTILSFIAKLTARPRIARFPLKKRFLSSSGRAIWWLLRLLLNLLDIRRYSLPFYNCR